MAKTRFSVVPDSLINIGTGFGILLGLAVGVMTGLMITPTEQVNTNQAVAGLAPSATEQTVGTLRTLLVQRASLLASTVRLDRAKANPAAPTALLDRNIAMLTMAAQSLSTPTAGTKFAQAMANQTTTVRNLAVILTAGDSTGTATAKQALLDTAAPLARALTGLTGPTSTNAQPLAQTMATALVHLAETADNQQQTYATESTLVAVMDQLATFIRTSSR